MSYETVIFGYYGNGNLGDETNLRELVAWLQTQTKITAITAISHNPFGTSQNLKISAIGKFDWLAIWQKIRNAKLLIGGGGSLFQDRTSLRSLLYYSTILLWAKLFKVQICLYGQGIGPIETKLGRIFGGWVLSQADLITVRDRLSIITLAELKALRPKVYLTAEPLLALPSVAEGMITQAWKGKIQLPGLKVGLIARELATFTRRDWYDLLALLARDPQIRLYLIMGVEQKAELDHALAGAGVSVLNAGGSWEQFQAVLGGLDLVVSARLHGLVAAVNQGIPCYGLAIDPKLEGFCLQLGVPYSTLIEAVNTATLAELTAKLQSLLAKPFEERRPWLQDRGFWQARAHENQLILKQLINKELTMANLLTEATNNIDPGEQNVEASLSRRDSS